MVLGSSYTIVAQNICENDSGYPNADCQGIGIQVSSVGSEFTTYKSVIVRDNICRNHVHYQLFIGGADGIALLEGNVQEGNNAAYRAWHQQRGRFAGTGVPSAADGQFRAGDMIANTAATRTKNIAYWHCVEDGAPGAWHAVGCGWGKQNERPALGLQDAGYQYMDTETNMVAVWSGSNWIGGGNVSNS